MDKPTKQKILEIAIDLFAEKGFTETSMREIAKTAGIKEASIYSHFTGKNDILDFILNEYINVTAHVITEENIEALIKNPSPEGILKCTKLVFPEERRDYYLKILCVILQEHFRNEKIRDFVCGEIIFNTENVSKTILNELVKAGILAKETKVEYWARTHSAILYSFATRHLLRIGEMFPGFTAPGMQDMLVALYNLMFEVRGRV
jgi:AcrR family transcriptional regulator